MTLPRITQHTVRSMTYQPHFQSEEIRMFFKKILPTTCTLLALSVPAWAQNTQYDFDYRTTDQRVQVFDDGKVTRIQVPEGTQDPTIVAIEPKGEVLLKPTKESPYLVLNGIYSRLVMRWGNRREVQAVYGGGANSGLQKERTGSAAAFGSVEAQAKFGSVAKPVEVVLAKPATAAPEVVVARAPVAVPAAVEPVAAVAATTPQTKPAEIKPALLPQEPVQPAKTWKIDVRDVTLSNTFTRWAEASGQKIRWDADKHVLVEAPDTLSGSFEDVVTAVLSSPGIAQGAYPLEVCFYPNNPPLARITRKGEQGKECK